MVSLHQTVCFVSKICGLGYIFVGRWPCTETPYVKEHFKQKSTHLIPKYKDTQDNPRSSESESILFYTISWHWHVHIIPQEPERDGITLSSVVNIVLFLLSNQHLLPTCKYLWKQALSKNIFKTHVYRNDKTRQLPMGAGHCQWGGYTDGNVCNTKNEAPRSDGLGATGVH